MTTTKTLDNGHTDLEIPSERTNLVEFPSDLSLADDALPLAQRISNRERLFFQGRSELDLIRANASLKERTDQKEVAQQLRESAEKVVRELELLRDDIIELRNQR